MVNLRLRFGEANVLVVLHIVPLIEPESVCVDVSSSVAIAPFISIPHSHSFHRIAHRFLHI